MQFRTVVSIINLVNKGYNITLVTGRNKHVSSKVGKRIKTNELTIIGCNGALIVQNGKVIEEFTDSNKDNQKMYFGLGGHPAFSCEYTSGKYRKTSTLL